MLCNATTGNLPPSCYPNLVPSPSIPPASGGSGGGSTAAQSPRGGNSDTENKKAPSEPSEFPDKKKIHIGFNRICSVSRSRMRAEFYEEVGEPLFTLEATPGKHCSSSKVRQSYEQYGSNTRHTTPKKTVRIASMDMKGINLFRDRSGIDIDLDLEDLKKRTWKDYEVAAFICNDTNNNGMCSDESNFKVLVLSPSTFALKHIPSSLNLTVWHGRHLTRKSNPESCEIQRSPLLLDLAGDGFKLVGHEHGVRFDINNEGFAPLTGWVKAGGNDAFLVRDLNGDGQITSGAEMFGSATRMRDGSRAVNGFEALRELDSNQNGKIDSGDAEWDTLLLWRDRNGNGMTDRRELVPLSTNSIRSINLNYINLNETDLSGNETRQRSTFEIVHGVRVLSRLVIDVWFNTLVQ